MSSGFVFIFIYFLNEMFNFIPFRMNIIRSLRWESLKYVLMNAERKISFSAPMAFNTTPSLMAMPQKKKRRVDPQILKVRLERKRKKIEKEIRLLEKVKKTLKPIEEARRPAVLLYEKEARQRQIHVPEDMQEERILMLKEWSRYTHSNTVKDLKNIQNIMRAQETALNELKKESIELYNAAIQIDENLINFKYAGPSDTPAIKGYICPDGDYIDVSKNWYQDQKSKK